MNQDNSVLNFIETMDIKSNYDLEGLQSLIEEIGYNCAEAKDEDGENIFTAKLETMKIEIKHNEDFEKSLFIDGDEF